MAISLQSFKVKNRVRRCGFPRKSQSKGSLPWINGALPGRLCESESPMRSSQNIFKLALPGPGTQGSGAEICRPHPDSYLSRNHENFGVHCCLYGYSRSRTTVCLAQVTRMPWASTAGRQVHDNLRGASLCTVMIFYGELFTPDSLDSTGKVLVSNREDTVSLGILESHSGCHDSPGRGSCEESDTT